MLQIHLRNLPNEKVQLRLGKTSPSIRNQGAVHLPFLPKLYSIVGMVTLHPRRETKIKIKQTWSNSLISPATFFNVVFYEVMKTLIDIQMLTLSRWHCCKMQDIRLVCHVMSVRVSGAFKAVLSFTFTFAAININKRDFSH